MKTMKQKTVYLSDDYRLRNGVVEGYTYRDAPLPAGAASYHDLSEAEYDEWQANGWRWAPSKYAVGAEVCLVCDTDVGPNVASRAPDRWRLVFGPVPGNSDPKITRWHGWRGTTNDNHVSAHGRRRIVRIREVRGCVAITVGRDLAPDED